MLKTKRYKAEAFDKMQYFYRNAHEPLIRCLIKLSGHIDETFLEKAVSISADAIPMIRCVFDKQKHCWKDVGFTGQDIVRVIAVYDHADETIGRLFATKINIFEEPQLKINIAREKETDTLCMVMNHMVCDGAGFKEYLYLLANLYDKCKNHVQEMPVLKCGPRSALQLFLNLRFHEKLKILFLKHDLSAQKNQTPYVLEGDACRPFFSTQNITSEEFGAIKNFARSREVTVNDLILTAYARVLHCEIGLNRVILPCPVDLRRYLAPEQEHGICNLTSNYLCDICFDNDEGFINTLKQVSSQLAVQKAGRNCLKSQMTLELVSRLLPFRVMENLFHKVFKIPLVSFSNLGVLDNAVLAFGDVRDAYLTGTVKQVPYFQIAVSTYNSCCTLSCNMYGTKDDQLRVERFLLQTKNELMNALG